MGGNAESAGRNAAQAEAIHNLKTAVSHLQCASAALDSARLSLPAAYVEQALHYCQLELAKYEPAIIIDNASD